MARMEAPRACASRFRVASSSEKMRRRWNGSRCGAKPMVQLSDMGDPRPMTERVRRRGQRLCTQSVAPRTLPWKGVSSLYSMPNTGAAASICLPSKAAIADRVNPGGGTLSAMR